MSIVEDAAELETPGRRSLFLPSLQRSKIRRDLGHRLRDRQLSRLHSTRAWVQLDAGDTRSSSLQLPIKGMLEPNLQLYTGDITDRLTNDLRLAFDLVPSIRSMTNDEDLDGDKRIDFNPISDWRPLNMRC